MYNSGTSEDEIIENAKKEIHSAVQRSWSVKKEAVLLSRLGIQIGHHSELIRHELGMKLADFIRSYMREEIIILSDPWRPGVQGLIPLEGRDLDTYSLFVPKESRTESDVAGPNYYRGFWSAFRIPLEVGKRRFIIQEDHQWRFKDQDEELPPPEGGVEVQKHWIPDPKVFRPRDEVYQAIEKWSKENGIDTTRYIWSGKVDDTIGNERRRQNLLERLISTLTEEELMRVNLPGDIIKKLLRS